MAPQRQAFINSFTCHRLGIREIMVRFPARIRGFLFVKGFRKALLPNEVQIQKLLWKLFGSKAAVA